MKKPFDTKPLVALPAPSLGASLRATRQALEATEASLGFVQGLRSSAQRLGEAAEALRAAHPEESRLVADLCASVASVQRVTASVIDATYRVGVHVAALGLVVSARAMADEAARREREGAS